MKNRTKGKWEIVDRNFIAVDDKELICEVYDRANFLPREGTIVPDEHTGAANAEFIVTACNNHDALVTALETIRGLTLKTGNPSNDFICGLASAALSNIDNPSK